MQTTRVIDLNKEINPTFRSVWHSNRPYNILKGGRNSFKSSTISLKLVFEMLKYIDMGEQVNVIVIRKVGATISDSVYLKMQWAFEKFGIPTGKAERFKTQISPRKIIDTITESAVYFYGQDDFEKLKSSAVENVLAVWYEEAAEFKNVEEFDQTNITFMRQKHRLADFVQFYWSYNPPRNQYSWINEWAEEVKYNPDYLVHTSTYLDDRLGFVNEQMLKDIERIKESDPDYYRYLYLGEPVGLGTNIYNFDLFKKITQIPDTERIIYLMYGLDTGHQQSASACVCAGMTNLGNIVVLECWYYSPLQKERKLAPDEQSNLIHNFVRYTEKKYAKPIHSLTIDSAEGAIRNQYYKDFNERWNPVSKPKKVTMTDYVVTLLAQGRIYVIDNESNKLFLEQHRDYRWKENTIFTDNPQVVEEEDHLPDAFQYMVCDNLRELNLVW